MIDPGFCKIEGFVKIHNPITGEVLVDKKNAIHYENISIAMAQTLSDRTAIQGGGWIYSMAFGNGGSCHVHYKIYRFQIDRFYRQNLYMYDNLQIC
jgi:hypothetical protein